MLDLCDAPSHRKKKAKAYGIRGSVLGRARIVLGSVTSPITIHVRGSPPTDNEGAGILPARGTAAVCGAPHRGSAMAF